MAESSALVKTILCSLVEAPRDVIADLHPTRPWVLSCVDLGDDMGVTAAIYDYRRRQTIVSTNLAPAGAASVTAAAAPQAAATAASASAAAASAGGDATTTTTAAAAGQKPPGALRILRFFDSNVRACKGFLEAQALSKPPAAAATAAGDGAEETADLGRVKDALDACGTYAVLVCEYRVVFVDYITGQVACEIFASDLRGAQATALELFARHRWLAFGCNDGTIRLWDVDTRQFIRGPGPLLSGGHKTSASVTRLFSFEREGTAWLVSAGSDGAVCLWNVTAGKLEKALPKAHDGGIADLTFHAPSGLLVTTGTNDKTIVVWDLQHGLQEVRRTPTGKKPYAAAQAFVHPQFPAHSLLFFKRDSQELQVTDFNHTDSRTLVSIVDIRAPSRKESKSHKIHGIARHPLHPHLVLINSSKGAFLLRISFARPPDCAVIRRSAAQGRVDVLAHYEDAGKAICKYLTSKAASDPEIVADLRGSNTIMTFNRAGTFLLVQYPDLQTYQLFNTASLMGWKIVEEGHFRGLIGMATKQERYAFVEAVYPQVEQKASKGLFKKKDDKPVQPTMRFVIKEISDAPKVVFEMPAPPRLIQQIHGGQLMGVTWLPLDSKDQLNFQFYKWDSLCDSSKVGKPMQMPKAVVWDANRPMVAMLFKTSFGIYTIKLEEREPVSLLFTHRLSVTSLLWDTSMLFISTDDTIKCYFTNAKDDPITIASHHADTNASEEETPFAASRRPPGALALVANADDKLWVMDCSRQFHAIPLGGAILRCFSAAVSRNLQQALKFAESVHPRFHFFVAAFFARHGLKRETLHLAGLDDFWKLRFCVSNKLFEDALPLVGRIAKGFQTRADQVAAASTDPNGESEENPVPRFAFSLGKLVDAVADLAAMARAAGGAQAKTAVALLRAIVPLDPHRGFMLLALHFATTGNKAEAAALAKEVAEFAETHKGTFVAPVAAFAMACAGDSSGMAAAWKAIC